ncbi:MAG: PD40 domain-containing protein [Marinilabiliaceae bacterium]|nr:PD40 domain-containing protein [Marinilabiliaceae bacterium]
MKRSCIYLVVVVLFLLTACVGKPYNVVKESAMPPIYPDYIGVTIPVGIAPLNFNIIADGFDGMVVHVRGKNGVEISAEGEYAQFGIDEWHNLLAQNKGEDITVTVTARVDGRWVQYSDFTIHVSQYPLDAWGVTYRRIAPGYEVYSKMGIYQRDLSNFDESPIFENTSVTGSCVNCHTSNRTNPDQFVFHVRGEHGATAIQNDGRCELLKAKNDSINGAMVYPYWHPMGRYCAFSTNQTRQGFHVVRDERVEVFDLSSDILVYDAESNEIILSPIVSKRETSENLPVFSPDGEWIYFITSPQHDYPLHFRDEKYDLCRIAFSSETGEFGIVVDTLFKASSRGKSVTWPRPSYDGKYLVFTLIDYGYFSIWHKEADFWIMNLETGESRCLSEINSIQSESSLNWSNNSRWIVFTSRRENGLYTQLYLSSIGDDGLFTKPFLLPQEKPWEYYDATLYSFNTPDFTCKPVDFDVKRVSRELVTDRRVNTVVRK